MVEMDMPVTSLQRYREAQLTPIKIWWDFWTSWWTCCLPKVRIERQIITFPPKEKK